MLRYVKMAAEMVANASLIRQKNAERVAAEALQRQITAANKAGLHYVKINTKIRTALKVQRIIRDVVKRQQCAETAANEAIIIMELAQGVAKERIEA